MQKGKIGITTENIFPIIKKFLYSDHEIFLREIVSNAVDATQKLKTLASVGEFKGELGNYAIQVKVDKEAKTITVSDRGIGMTEEEVEKYINQIAFSSAEEFLDKYKDQPAAIIGHFGLGFYSSFMVSERVDLITKSYKDGAEAVKWSCDGSPEYTLEPAEKAERGTDIVLHVDEENQDFLEENKIKDLLKKYCKFLPVEIAFGKKKEWKDGKYEDTAEDDIINDTKPAWTRKPSELKDEDYTKFYRDLYPTSEEPMFNIHLNVDYPFNLTGILYFPKIKSNIEIQKNKIQLYCNQVFVTDSVEGIVPDFLTLLHGVIDSPDIPLNVSRSYLQSDSNVKKISGHITKKVADRLQEIYKNNRPDFEQKWDNLKLFIVYGIITDEKFWERAEKFTLLKNTDNKYFSLEEYQTLIKENQTDKDKKVVYLYATDTNTQFTFIEAAKAKGYDVLLFDGQLDSHFINHLEHKQTDVRFVRVDSDVADKLIPKTDAKESKLSWAEQSNLIPVFKSPITANKEFYTVQFEDLSETDLPVQITQSEFMRRMKEMSANGGGGMNFYGEMPDSYNLVVNTHHPLVKRIIEDKDAKVGEQVKAVEKEMDPLKDEISKLHKKQSDKKDEEISQAEKDQLSDLEKKEEELKSKKEEILSAYGKENNLVKQLIDLALLANNQLKGEELMKFVKRSFEMIK
jgi:molecular chaperone HtpG